MEENSRLEVGKIYSPDVVEFFLAPGNICHPICLTIISYISSHQGSLSLIGVRLDKRESLT